MAFGVVYANEFPGVVRPMLEWHVKQVSETAAIPD